MAISQKAFDAAISAERERLYSALRALVRTPDDVRRTGRIAGFDSRYTLKVWYSNSGHAYATLIHHHPNQSDWVCTDGYLDDLNKHQRSDDAEGRAIRDMIWAALQAHLATFRVQVA